jgi:DUF1680 family protein
LIVYIALAQTEDGYLQTWRIIDPDKPGADWWGNAERWSAIRHGHELYNVGHLYEAAVAHFKATGKKTLLEVALKNADLVATTFGTGKKIAVPGHEEIEIGLVKLYRVTGIRKYLDLARFFVDQRGVDKGRELLGEYHQDHIPVREQRTAVGHAVRAGYLYSAMADIAAFTGDSSYIPALDSIWKDMVFRKIYITGGIGASRSGEAFGNPYELPNSTAYAETCASIANVLWNHRMFLLKGEGKYYDILERTLYNGLLSGVSQSGDRFFYPNPLSSDGHTAFNYGSATRQEWFPCACCPSNISRFMPEIPGYIYAFKTDTIFINLYIANTADILFGNRHLRMELKTDYPWEGKISLKLDPEKSKKFVLALRIPGWSVNHLIPGDLYAIQNPSGKVPVLSINKSTIPIEIENGFVYLNRSWKPTDQIDLTLPMDILKVKSHPNLETNAGKIALQRGPLVYCWEEVDNCKNLDRILVKADSRLKLANNGDFGKIKGIQSFSKDATFQAIPYFLWSNRGANEMAVWIPDGTFNSFTGTDR